MTARFFPFLPPRSASFNPQRRRSLSTPNGPRMWCAPCTSSVRRYGSPSLLMCICGSLCPQFPRPGSYESDARLPMSARRLARSACLHPSPAAAAPPADNFPAPVFRSVRCTRRCVHLTSRFPPATAPVPVAVLDSAPPLSPDSYSARCTRAVALRSSWPVRAPCSPAPFVPAPVPLAPGSPSDPLAPSRCDASPDTATADRSAPAVPASAHPADHLSFGSLQSSARYAHAPRSLRVPTRSTIGSPRANACRFPVRSGSPAFLQTLPSSPSESCPAAAPAPLRLVHPTHNTNSNDRPDRNRSSASARENSCSASSLRC